MTADPIDVMAAAWRDDIDSVPEPDMPEFTALLKAVTR